jgi:quinol monooxygenase YgiN
MELMTVEFQATPFRAERFRKLYEPAIARAASFGSTGHLFYRSEEDPDHFVHMSFWNDKRDFERYWFSREMQEIRQQIAGLYALPVLPHWNVLISRG